MGKQDSKSLRKLSRRGPVGQPKLIIIVQNEYKWLFKRKMLKRQIGKKFLILGKL